MDSVKLGLLGVGTVGSGTINVLQRNACEISRRAGRNIVISKALVRDITKSRKCNLNGLQLTEDPYSVVDDPEIEVIVELLGGIDLARELILRAIDNGKHIVTANKALIAKHGNSIFEKAKDKGVIVAFEAAVAGGIPIIKTIREGLTGNQIEWIVGIINGTSNYILSEMSDKCCEFTAVLAEAQQLGYAEADPSFDVDGIDAAEKLTILASIAFGIPLQFEKIYTEGISRIKSLDVEYARQLGYSIKLLGIARRTIEGIELRVHPTLIPENILIARVNGVMNSVLVKGDAVGQSLSCGAGAGSEPTASSVTADVIDVVRSLTVNPDNRVPVLAFQADRFSDLPILKMENIETAYYLRIHAIDTPGVLSDITRILSDRSISIEAILQKSLSENNTDVPIIILTHRTFEKNMNDAVAHIEELKSIVKSIMLIRMEYLNDNW